MPFTTRGLKLMFDWSFRTATRESFFHLVLITSASVPTAATKTMSELTQIASGNGYSTGGFTLNANSTDLNVLIEDDGASLTYIGLKNIAWTASGGPIPSSGSGASHVVLTTSEPNPANWQVIWYQSLNGTRTVSSGNTLQLTGIQARIQGGSVVKTIQRGTITMTTTTTSSTGSISAVDESKSVVELLGFSSSSSSDSDVTDLLPRLDLTNSTTVTATRGHNTSLNGTLSINFQVTEYY